MSGTEPSHGAQLLVVAMNMGYGHLRAAYPIAEALGVPVLAADEAPLADAEERRRWAGARTFHELTSRAQQIPLLGRAFRFAMDAVTEIPHLYPHRDLSAPTLAVRYVERLARRGVGRGLVAHLRDTGAQLLTTFYTPAVLADRAGCRGVHCVVTDSDCNRIWVQAEPARSHAVYFAPSRRVVRRLASYGVAPENIRYTGFPLPLELLGGPSLPVLRRNLAARLVRLDPARAFRDVHGPELPHLLGVEPADTPDAPPLLVYAVGGAGAQADLVRHFLPGFHEQLRTERIRIALVAGVRAEVKQRFTEWVEAAGLGAFLGNAVRIVYDADMGDYLRRFNALMAETDILWTKPSEITFFAALGIPLVLSAPVGAQEFYNRRWAREAGAGLKARDARHAAEWIEDWLVDGTLAAAAWSGFLRLPKRGTYRILETLGHPVPDEALPDGAAARSALRRVLATG